MNRTLSAIEAVRSRYGYAFEPDGFEDNDTRIAPGVSIGPLSPPVFRQLADVSLDTGEDVDYYQFELTDWADLTLGTFYPLILNDFEIVFTRTDGGTAPLQVSNQRSRDGRVRDYEGLAPGDYLIMVRNLRTRTERVRRETLYTPNIDLRPIPAPGPDLYELNNGFYAAYRFDERRGTFHANHHTALDFDDYYFEVGTTVLGESMTFAIRTTDHPLTVRLLDGSNTVVTETVTGTGPGSEQFQVPDGSWRVRVAQADGLAGRYTFTAMGAVPLPPQQQAGDSFPPHPFTVWWEQP